MDIFTKKTLNAVQQNLEENEGVKVEHLNSKFAPDTPDIVWLKSLADEGDWFVITKDSQIRKRTNERKAWKDSHIPVVYLAKSWMSFSFWDIVWRFIKSWPELKQCIMVNKNKESFELTVKGKTMPVE